MPGKNRKINLKNRMLDAYKKIYTYEDTQNALERSKPEPGDNYSAQFASNYRNYNKSRNMVKTFRIALKNVFTDDDVIMDMLDKCMTDAEKEKMKKEYTMYELEASGNFNYNEDEIEEVDPKDIKPKVYLACAYKTFTDEDFRIRFFDALPEQYAEAIDEELDKLKMPDERETKELLTYPYKERIDEIKHNVSVSAINEKEKARLNTVLDRANECLAGMDKEANTYYQDMYSSCYSQLDIRERKRSVKRGFETEEYKDLKNYDTDREADVPAPEEQKPYIEKVRSLTPPALTPKYKQGVLRMLEKMEEVFGDMTPEEIAAYKFEEGSKIYANRKLVKSREALRNAVAGGNTAEIETSLKAYEKDLKDVKDLHKMAEEVFAESDPYGIPGNIDTMRNDAVPLEVKADVRNEARVNGMFHLWIAAKKTGTSFEEFIENPGKKVYESIDKEIEEKSAINELKKNPFYFLDQSGKIKSRIGSESSEGIGGVMDRGIRMLTRGEPNQEVRDKYHVYQYLTLSETSRCFRVETENCEKIAEKIRSAKDNKEAFTAIAGGCLLDAGYDYDWGCGFANIDTKGYAREKAPLKLKDYIKAHPDTDLVAVNERMMKYLDDYDAVFNSDDRQSSVEAYQELRDVFLRSMIISAGEILKNANINDPGYRELYLNVSLLPHMIKDEELKNEAVESFAALEKQYRKAERKSGRNVEEAIRNSERLVNETERRDNFLKVYGPKTEQYPDNFYGLEMDLTELPVPEGYSDDDVALLCLGTTMDEKNLKNVKVSIDFARDVLIENIPGGDNREYYAYEPMKNGRDNTQKILRDFTSGDENVKNRARAEMDKMYDNILAELLIHADRHPISAPIDATHLQSHLFKVADEAIIKGHIVTDELTKAKIHSHAEQVRALERESIAAHELLTTEAGKKDKEERREKVFDLMFDAYLRSTGERNDRLYDKKAEQAVKDAFARMGENPDSPANQVFAEKLTKEARKVIESSVDPVSAILLTENGRQKLKEMFKASIVNSKVYKDITSAEEPAFSEKLAQFLTNMNDPATQKSLNDFTDVNIPTEEADRLNNGSFDTVVNRAERHCADKLILRISKYNLMMNAAVNDYDRNGLSSYAERNGKMLDVFHKAYGVKTDIGNLHRYKAEYDSIIMPKPEGFTDEMITAACLGNALNRNELGEVMTTSAVGQTNRREMVDFNQGFIVQNVPDNDARMNDANWTFSDHTLKCRKDSFDKFNRYIKTGDSREVGRDIDYLIDYAYQALSSRSNAHIVNTASIIDKPEIKSIKLALKVFDAPPLHRKGNLNDIQVKQMKAFAAQFEETDKTNELALKIKDEKSEPGSPEREKLVSEMLLRNYMRSVVEQSYGMDNEEAEKISKNVYHHFGFMKEGATASDRQKEDYEAVYRELSHFEAPIRAQLKKVRSRYNINPQILMLSEEGYYEKFKDLYLDKIKKTPEYKYLVNASDEALPSCLLGISNNGNIRLANFDVTIPEDVQKGVDEIKEKYRAEYELELEKANNEYLSRLAERIKQHYEIDNSKLLDIGSFDSVKLKKNAEMLESMKSNLIEGGKSRTAEYKTMLNALDSLIDSAAKLAENPDKEGLDEYNEMTEKYSDAMNEYCKKHDESEPVIAERAKEIALINGLNNVRVNTAYLRSLEMPVRDEEKFLDTEDSTIMKEYIGGKYGDEGFNMTASLAAVQMSGILTAINQEKFNNVFNSVQDYKDSCIQTDMNNPDIKKGLRKSEDNSYNLILLGGDPEKREKAFKEIKEAGKLIDEQINNAAGKASHFVPFMRANKISLEYDKGSYAHALLDNQYLSDFSHLILNAGPQYIKKQGKNEIDFDRMYDNLSVYNKAPGILEPFENLAKDHNALYEKEYERQRLEKEGWTEEKEQSYLSGLKSALKKAVDDYTVLKQFIKMNPGAYEDKVFLGDSPSAVTGVNVDTNRNYNGTFGQMEGQIRAIENGWGPDELHVLGSVGELEAILASRLETDKGNPEKIQEYGAMLSGLRKMKDEVWTKKVNGPEDKLEVFGKVNRFFTAFTQYDGPAKNLYENAELSFSKTKAKLENEIKLRDQLLPKEMYDNFRKTGNAEELATHIKGELASMLKNFKEKPLEFLNTGAESVKKIDVYNGLFKQYPALKDEKLDTEGITRMRNVAANFSSENTKKNTLLIRAEENLRAFNNLLPKTGYSMIRKGEESPMLRYAATLSGSEAFGNLTDALPAEFMDNANDNGALDKVQLAKISHVGFKAMAEGTVSVANEKPLNYQEMKQLTKDYIYATFFEGECKKAVAEGKVRNFLDFTGHAEDNKHKLERFDREVNRLADVFVRTNLEAKNFGDLLKENKELFYERTRQMEHHVDAEMNKESRRNWIDNYNLVKPGEEPKPYIREVPALDEAVNILKRANTRNYNEESYTQIRNELRLLNAEIKNADKVFRKKLQYVGEDLANREKKLLDKMDAYIGAKEDEVQLSPVSARKLAAMKDARKLVKSRYELDMHSANVNNVDQSEAEIYKKFIEKTEKDLGVRSNKKPAEILDDYIHNEEEYRKLLADVINNLEKNRRAGGNAEQINNRIAAEKKKVYKSVFRSVLLDEIKKKADKGEFKGVNEAEFKKRLTNSVVKNEKEISVLINSKAGKKVTAKIDSDIKKNRLDHSTAVRRVDATLSARLDHKAIAKEIKPARVR